MPNLFPYFGFPSPMGNSIYISNAIGSFNSRVKARLRKRVAMNSLGNREKERSWNQDEEILLMLLCKESYDNFKIALDLELTPRSII